jgi:hypothetical protein
MEKMAGHPKNALYTAAARNYRHTTNEYFKTPDVRTSFSAFIHLAEKHGALLREADESLRAAVSEVKAAFDNTLSGFNDIPDARDPQRRKSKPSTPKSGREP